MRVKFTCPGLMKPHPIANDFEWPTVPRVDETISWKNDHFKVHHVSYDASDRGLVYAYVVLRAISIESKENQDE